MSIDPALEIPVPDALDLVVEVADMMAIFAAQRLARVDAMRRVALEDAARHGRELTEVIERGVRLELAAALRITEHAAGELLRRAEALVHRYPAVLASLGRAAMTERHAEILVSGLDEVEPDLRDDLLPRALELAESQQVGTFRRSLRKLIDYARSVTLAQRHEEALAKRRSVIEHVDDGMAWLHLYIPAVEVRAIDGRAAAIAKVIVAQEDETRTLDQARADVMCNLLIEGRTDLHPVEARGIRANVVVTVPALALLTEDDAARAAAGVEPAVVEGLGPVPLERARELCGGADGWMRILTHPETGAVLSVGRDLYRTPSSLRRIVAWRAERCMGPGCGMPASRCEIDHTVAWEHGGSTSLDNLAPLCRGHHRVKHHGGWQVRQVPDTGGALEWTSPAGRRYVVEPERRVPVFRPSADADAPF
ncbi:HNH endonuclease signature motif containing protein [Microbacterium sp. CPCC 204701]|uniref:HNH endonuclease signature motif containing protein n=1 Tax=Microbacterium sp. CPCC 204701 TaxID=2493084 RepID=UPI000FDB124E|nr:HNH endonuclease signature motif containing protein [Microbacterium sp. CPCC 204701]